MANAVLVIPAFIGISAAFAPEAVRGQSPAAFADKQSALSTYMPAPNLFPPHFFRIELPGVRDQSDYLADVLKVTNGHVFRFAAMPIPISVDPTQEPGYMDACLKAFDNWELRSNGLIRFALTDDLSQARIKVVWIHRGLAKNPAADSEGAYTSTPWHAMASSPSIANGAKLPPLGMRGAQRYVVDPQTIAINLDVIASHNADGRLILLQNIITHELGHALGLAGHSPLRGDMMFANTDEFSRVSQRDLNTLMRLYAMPTDVLM